jgi:hypothetical protein
LKVKDLTSGDVCQNPQHDGRKGWATVIAVAPSHPVYPSCALVVWHMAWEEGAERWSFDALSPEQELDHMSPLVEMGPLQRAENMRRVLQVGPWRK